MLPMMGKALHIAEGQSEQDILDHPKHIGDIYERTEIVGILAMP